MELYEILPNGTDAVDDEARDVRHVDDLVTPSAPGLPVDDEYRYAAEINESAKPAARVAGPLETRIDDWLDVHRTYNSELTDADACEALGFSLAEYNAEVEASYAAVAEVTVEPEKISGRSIIEALRQRQLDACTTDTERREMQARFIAEDAKRAKGPMA